MVLHLNFRLTEPDSPRQHHVSGRVSQAPDYGIGPQLMERFVKTSVLGVVLSCRLPPSHMTRRPHPHPQ